MKQTLKKLFPFLVPLYNWYLGKRRKLDKKKRLDSYKGKAIDTVFNDIYEKGAWGSNESVSGPGSELKHTEMLRKELPGFLKKHNITTFLDAPCGDFNWMKEIELPVEKYIGGDIVEELIKNNDQCYTNEQCSFQVIDLTSTPLPDVDMIFCRDCLVHLSFEMIQKVFANLRASNITYLMTTTFPGRDKNVDIVTGAWRPLNFQSAPFSFPEPIDEIKEFSMEEGGKFIEKTMALWRIKDLPF